MHTELIGAREPRPNGIAAPKTSLAVRMTWEHPDAPLGGPIFGLKNCSRLVTSSVALRFSPSLVS